MAEPTFLVSGLVNIETTCRVPGFPLDYTSQRFEFDGIASRASGVGLNVAAALSGLGNRVEFHSMIGRDPGALLVQDALARHGIDGSHVARALDETPRSVILYEPSGRRASTTDLKDIQDRRYADDLRDGLSRCDWAVLCNLSANRPALAVAAELGRPIATDVHGLSDVADDYNADFMAAAAVLFCSHEHLPGSPAEVALALAQRYSPDVVVIGMGADGALLATQDEVRHVPAHTTRPIISTIGAGDALFSAFLHTYARTGDAHEALRRATWFASWKIGAASASEGFPSVEQWRRLHG